MESTAKPAGSEISIYAEKSGNSASSRENARLTLDTTISKCRKVASRISKET
jgi:hypothetical protein